MGFKRINPSIQRMHRTAVGWVFSTLLVSSSIISSLSYPNVQYVSASTSDAGLHSASHPQVQQQRHEHQQQQQHQSRTERKFAEKPNAIKKVALDDLNDIETNQISESSGGGGFSWSNLLGMVMQMIFNPGGGNQGPNKSDDLDGGQVAPPSPWANLLSVGLKILTAILGGGAAAPSEGIDKVDNGNSPMQFIGIVMNLLEALKTSFSHRSMAARHLGRKDSVSDAAVAGVAMMKGYVRSISNGDEKCMQKYVCEANSECSKDIGQTSLFCHLGSYAVSFILDKSAPTTSFEMLYEAGRKGRFGDNCREKYLECNEV